MQTSPIVIGLTGGIATGKSTCCEILRKLLPETVVFDADACVRRLYRDPLMLDALGTYFGSAIRDDHHGVNKVALRQKAFAEPESREFLEQLFHPKVRKECLALLEQTVKKQSSRLFVADIPLLFESGFDFGQSANLLVATSRKTQIVRLKNRNDWDDDTMDAVLASQMPIEVKVSLADMVFWNEGPAEVLKNQCRRFLQSAPCKCA